MKNKETARKMSIDAGKFNEMMEMIHTEHHRLKGENEDLKIENEKLKEKYEKIRVRSCDRNQELVKALSPWKKNQEDHKRILEAIVEQKGENEHFKRKIQKLEKENECLKEDMVRLENENDKLKEKYKYCSDTCSHYSHYHEFVMDCSNREWDFEEWLKENCMVINDDGKIVYFGENRQEDSDEE